MIIRKAALIGLGAIGTVYGHLLHARYPEDFCVIASGERAEKIEKQGARQNGERFFPRVAAPEKSDFRADLIIVCVKNYQLDQALDDMRNFVGENTLILPLLNGITARDRIQERYPAAKVFYGLSIYIDAVRTNSGVANTANGVIQFGYAQNTPIRPEVDAVRAFLSEAGVQTEVCPDMIRTIWKKWMLNVGCNQVSAVTGAPYGKMMTIETNRILFHEAMTEVVELAEASGVALTPKDAQEFEELMKSFSPNGKTSMLQDIEARRKTEVDYFAGTAVELGKKYGVPTPVNHVLYCVIHSLEQMERE